MDTSSHVDMLHKVYFEIPGVVHNVLKLFLVKPDLSLINTSTAM